jgi:hypothetical protein
MNSIVEGKRLLSFLLLGFLIMKGLLRFTVRLVLSRGKKKACTER